MGSGSDRQQVRDSALVFAALDGLIIAVAAAIVFDALGDSSIIWRSAIAAALVAAVAAHRVGAAVATRRVRSQLEAKEQARRRLATHDPVTGLRNRFLVVDDLRRRALVRPDAEITVMLLAVDQIGTIQRALGHDQSDALTLRVAQRLRDELTDTEQLGRLDSGEFVIVADGATEDLPARLLAVVAEPQRLGTVDVVATATIGVARGDANGDPAGLLSEASLALAAAQSSGSGRVATANPSLRAEELNRLRLASELSRAVPDRELEVYYQPIVALPDRRVVGAEALIRWNHPREGVLTPDRWLAIADEVGLLPEIGRSTLDEVCRRFATLNAGRRDDPLRVTVNLAASELDRTDLVEFVESTLAGSGLDPTALVVEVDGDVFGHETAMDTIRGLHALGVAVSMDDVGSGFLALPWLGQVPVDELKLDRALVERLDQPVGQGRGVAEAVIDVVLRLGLAITAEGVGTESQAERLTQLHCPRAQGWLFGRPLPYSRFSGLIDRMAAPEPVDQPTAGPPGSLDTVPAPTGTAGEARSPLDRLR